MLLEGVGDVLEEDQAEDDVLVFGGVHAAAQRVGHLPELGLVADVRRGGVGPGGPDLPVDRRGQSRRRSRGLLRQRWRWNRRVRALGR